MHHQGKVFGVGLSRTGTLSLATGLRLLGYSTIHYPFTLAEIKNHDASVDISVSARFQFLSKLYPGSKFILTTRDEEPWLASCEKHYDEPWRGNEPASWNVHQHAIAENDYAVYGTWQYDRDKFVSSKKRHETIVRQWFEDTPGRLLEIDITKGGNVWEPLIKFLGFDEIPFPWEHKGPQTE